MSWINVKRDWRDARSRLCQNQWSILQFFFLHHAFVHCRVESHADISYFMPVDYIYMCGEGGETTTACIWIVDVVNLYDFKSHSIHDAIWAGDDSTCLFSFTFCSFSSRPLTFSFAYHYLTISQCGREKWIFPPLAHTHSHPLYRLHPCWCSVTSHTASRTSSCSSLSFLFSPRDINIKNTFLSSIFCALLRRSTSSIHISYT